MDTLLQVLALAGVLGSGIIGGVFFAFSSFVMPALGRLPSEHGIAAMQSINVTVLRPSFLGVFMGTALLSAGAVVVAGLRWEVPGSALLAAAGALYFFGTFLVTGTRNVPLNNLLEKVNPAEAEAAETWAMYLRQWVLWNHVRTVAALLATASFSLALAQHAAG